MIRFRKTIIERKIPQVCPVCNGWTYIQAEAWLSVECHIRHGSIVYIEEKETTIERETAE